MSTKRSVQPDGPPCSHFPVRFLLAGVGFPPEPVFRSSLKDVVALRAEDHDALVEVVVLHGGGGVEDGERRVHLGLEGVVGATVVQVVAQARHQQPEDLEEKNAWMLRMNAMLAEDFFRFTRFQFA